MTPNSPLRSALPAGGERQQFLQLARQVAETIGSEFFALLVDQLAGLLGAESVYIGEFVSRGTERVQVLAASIGGGRAQPFDFPLAGTPDAEVALGSPCLYTWGVREAFPGDRVLHDLKADACVGVPLNSAEGQPCGLIAALFSHPLNLEIHFVQAMLTMFAPRASAELNRKRSEDALRESEQRHRAFVESNPDACWRVEFDEPIDTSLPEKEQLAAILRCGRVAECNQALVQKVGLARDELIGRSASEVVLDIEAAHSSVLSMIRSGYRHNTVEVSLVDRKGRRRHFLDSYWCIVENGRLQRIWGSSREVTQITTLEAQFRQLQKLESIGKLAGGVAHDFNNLLAVIHGYSSQLMERTSDTDPAYLGLAEIRKAAERGVALTSQLLTFSRKQHVRMQLLDLSRIVTEDEQMLRRLIGGNIELIVESDPSLGLVRADAGSMHQVIMNLAVNARDAMPKGGKLVVALSNVDIDATRPERLASVEPGAYVRLSVTDNGTGMTPDVQEHLFEPFFTTKEVMKGTGLGLSTVYGIVRQSGGHIIVQTEPNKGTTFELLFPKQVP